MRSERTRKRGRKTFFGEKVVTWELTARIAISPQMGELGSRLEECSRRLEELLKQDRIYFLKGDEFIYFKSRLYRGACIQSMSQLEKRTFYSTFKKIQSFILNG